MFQNILRFFAAVFLIASVALSSAAFASTVIKKGTGFNPDDFDRWLVVLREDAKKQGISNATIGDALSNVQHISKVIRLDRKQPEKTRTHAEYLKLVISEDRINRGRELMKAHQAELGAVGKKYGVQPRFIVALWGIETSYGKITGDYSIINALATLAYDGRRSAFFRTELINALKILDQYDHFSAADLKGSWAGAMGQSQFMPSSFLQYAVDENGDGKRDIWNTKTDVFASIANYLSKSGWNINETWGREVTLPPQFDFTGITKKTELTVAEWEARGIKVRSGAPIKEKNIRATLALPGGKHGRAYLAFGNYHVVMKWNRSDYFATAVGTLSDALR